MTAETDQVRLSSNVGTCLLYRQGRLCRSQNEVLHHVATSLKRSRLCTSYFFCFGGQADCHLDSRAQWDRRARIGRLSAASHVRLQCPRYWPSSVDGGCTRRLRRRLPKVSTWAIPYVPLQYSQPASSYRSTGETRSGGL